MKIKFETDSFLGQVKCLKFHPQLDSLLYASTGAFLCVYLLKEKGEKHITVFEKQVFPSGTQIHGFQFDVVSRQKTRVLLYGQKSLSILYHSFQSKESNSCLSVEEYDPPILLQLRDWVWNADFLPFLPPKLVLQNTENHEGQVGASVWEKSEKDLFLVATAHNVVQVWNISEKKRVYSKTCHTKCILYSSSFHFDSQSKTVTAASGTVFNSVLLWDPFDSFSVPFAELEGHRGVIFSVSFDKEGKHLCSSSDDRTIAVYKVDGVQKKQQAKILPLVQFVGHSARVWNCVFSPKGDHVLSCAEDAKGDPSKIFF